MNITFDLPWPPTSNTYWRRNGNRYFISTRGQVYRFYVSKLCNIYASLFDGDDKLRVQIKAYPPDKRKRDLDNLFKSVLDSLQAAEIYVDDSQIDRLSIERMPELLGKLTLTIEKIN